MNTSASRNPILAGIALASLLVYVLACTSFSPDDSKVLLPAFDPETGAACVLIYDRPSGTLEPVFTALSVGEPDAADPKACRMRPQWLREGGGFLVAWQHPERPQCDLELTVMPQGTPGLVRHIGIPEDTFDDAPALLMLPLPVVGSHVFLTDQSKVLRVDLRSGEMQATDDAEGMILCSDPAGQNVYALWGPADGGPVTAFGRLNLRSLAFEPIAEVPPGVVEDELQSLAISPDGRSLALAIELEEGQLEWRVIRQGTLAFVRRIGDESTITRVSPCSMFSPRGDVLYSSFVRTDSLATWCEYGLIEVPLNERPPRWTPLIRLEPGESVDGDLHFFQGGLSHDGRTWAVSSALLWAGNEHLADHDSALFLVDLRDPQRKVTNVRIPVPGRRLKLF